MGRRVENRTSLLTWKYDGLGGILDTISVLVIRRATAATSCGTSSIVEVYITPEKVIRRGFN